MGERDPRTCTITCCLQGLSEDGNDEQSCDPNPGPVLWDGLLLQTPTFFFLAPYPNASQLIKTSLKQKNYPSQNIFNLCITFTMMIFNTRFFKMKTNITAKKCLNYSFCITGRSKVQKNFSKHCHSSRNFTKSGYFKIYVNNNIFICSLFWDVYLIS